MKSTFAFIVLSLCLQFSYADDLPHSSVPPSPPSSTPTIKPRNWSNFLSRDSLSQIEGLGDKIPEALFNLVREIDVQMYSNSRFSLNLNVNRQVFSNGPSSGTWSVVDQIGIGGAIPLLATTFNISSGMIPLGFYIGTRAGVYFTDIRQVKPDDYFALPSPKQRKGEIRGEVNYQNYVSNREVFSDSKKSNWFKLASQKGQQLFWLLSPTGDNFARYSRIWNLAVIPFKLPLTVGQFGRMEQKEIISYTGHGAIEFGINVGWNIDPSAISSIITAGASVSTFIHGEYQISVIKMGDDVARIKVAKIATQGTNGIAGSDYVPSVLDNIIIVNKLNELFKIYPFKISGSVNDRFAFEVTYEYDLKQEGGRKAYEAAALGRFKMSDDLSLKPDGTWREVATETGVMRVNTVETDTHGESRKNSMRLTFLFERSSQGSLTSVTVKTRTPQGVETKFSALSETSREWLTVWNRYKSSQRSFSVKFIDKDIPKLSELGSIPLEVYGKIRDSKTYEKPMRNYLKEVEENVGIPPLPLDIPNQKESFGKTEIQYRVNYTPELMQQMITMSDDQMWATLEKAFGIRAGSWGSSYSRWIYYLARFPVSLVDLPLNLLQVNLRPGTDLSHANRVYLTWRDLKSIQDPMRKAEKLVGMFVDLFYSQELAHTMRMSVPSDEVPYKIDFSNSTLGTFTRERIAVPSALVPAGLVLD